MPSSYRAPISIAEIGALSVTGITPSRTSNAPEIRGAAIVPWAVNAP
jgi:hypothetical protein